MQPGLQRIRVSELTPEEGFSEALARGLSGTPKEIPSRFFYDARGSSLFERITETPEYYLTRCEQEILCERSPEIVSMAGKPLRVIELGSGSAKKTTLLIEAALAKQPDLEYLPIDISEEFMLSSARKLLATYPGLRVTAIAGEYFSALHYLSEESHFAHGTTNLFLFLGSNIGNFEDAEAEQLLISLRRAMRPCDFLLIGMDLDKDPSIIEPAYNDAGGVTEAFNKNLLVRINSELGGDFDLSAFRHHAPYLPSQRRVEMRLVSEREQMVTVLQSSYHFSRDEHIHTETSRKYSQADVSDLFASSGLQIEHAFYDSCEWFALMLVKPSALI